MPAFAEAADGGGDVRQFERWLRQRVRQDCASQTSAGQRQVIEGDVEERAEFRCPRERLLLLAVRLQSQLASWPDWPCVSTTGGSLCATQGGLPGGAFGGGQEPVAIPEALQRVEQVELRLPFLLHPFGFGEERAGFGALAGLMQGIRRRGTLTHSLEGIAALVGVGD